MRKQSLPAPGRVRLSRRMRQKGFTIIELLVVIGLVAILAAFAIPRFTRFNKRAILQDGALKTRDGLRTAQTLASAGLQDTSTRVDQFQFELLPVAGDPPNYYRGYRVVRLDESGSVVGGDVEAVTLTCGLCIQSDWNQVGFETPTGNVVGLSGTEQSLQVCSPEIGYYEIMIDVSGRITRGDYQSTSCSCASTCGEVESPSVPTPTPAPTNTPTPTSTPTPTPTPVGPTATPTPTPISPPVGADDFRVDGINNDAEEESNGEVIVSSSDLDLAQKLVGLRFTDVTIPQGATINQAYVEFTAEDPDSKNTEMIFSGQAADNAAAFNGCSSGCYDVSGRPQTVASVVWSNVPSWVSGQTYQSPDLSSIIQEIVDRPGWSSGNSLVIIVDGSGERDAESFEGEASEAPLLHIE